MTRKRRSNIARSPVLRAKMWAAKVDADTYARQLQASKPIRLDLVAQYQAAHEQLLSTVKGILAPMGLAHLTHEYMWYAEELYKATQTYTGQALQNKINAIYAKYRAKKLNDDALMKIAGSLGLTPDPVEKIFEIPLAVPGKGAPLVVVAAADTPSFLKDRADIICDGVSDQEEINSAFSSAPTVYLCPGTYIIDGPIIMPSYSRLMGSGFGTVIKLKDYYNADIYMIQNSDLENGNTGIIVENLTLDGNRANQEGEPIQDGIYFRKVNAGIIRSCYLKDFWDCGIALWDSENCEILENISIGSYYDGIFLLGTPNSRVSKNFTAQNYIGIGVWGFSHGCEISGNISISNEYDGIDVGHSNMCSVVGNVCRNNGRDGIGISSLNYCAVLGNALAENYRGINLLFAHHCVISNNSIYKSTLYGIRMYSSSYNLISGNVIRSGNVATYGIYIQDSACALNVLEGNNLYQSGITGDIYDAGTNTRRRDNIGNNGLWLADA